MSPRTDSSNDNKRLLREAARQALDSDQWAGIGWSDSLARWELLTTIAPDDKSMAELQRLNGDSVPVRIVERSYVDLEALSSLVMPLLNELGVAERLARFGIWEPGNCVRVCLAGQIEQRLIDAAPAGIVFEGGHALAGI